MVAHLLQRVTGDIIILIVTLTTQSWAILLTIFLTVFRLLLNYHINYGAQKQWQTTVGLIYQAKSGSPYSIYYYGDVNEDGANGNDLFFIPTDAQIDKMQFEETNFSANALTKAVFGDNFTAPKLTADMQRAMMKHWIGNDSYMKNHRGEYYKRYADNLAFEHHFDVHFAQKYSLRWVVRLILLS